MNNEELPSGKFVLRVGAQLHSRILTYARRRKLSLNTACVNLLRPALEGNSVSKGLPFALEKLLSTECALAAQIIGIVMFGSWARGEATAASDIDVLVVLANEIPISKQLYTEIDRVLGTDSSLSIALVNSPNQQTRPGSIWLEVAQDGIVVFDKEYQIARTLGRIRRSISSGMAIRRETHGQGYWVYAQ